MFEKKVVYVRCIICYFQKELVLRIFRVYRYGGVLFIIFGWLVLLNGNRGYELCDRLFNYDLSYVLCIRREVFNVFFIAFLLYKYKGSTRYIRQVFCLRWSYNFQGETFYMDVRVYYLRTVLIVVQMRVFEQSGGYC